MYLLLKLEFLYSHKPICVCVCVYVQLLMDQMRIVERWQTRTRELSQMMRSSAFLLSSLTRAGRFALQVCVCVKAKVSICYSISINSIYLCRNGCSKQIRKGYI